MELAKLEIYQLRSFVAVVHVGNLARAAEKLFLSQAAVSAHSQVLEDELGLSLKNERVHGPYYLTRDAAIADLFDYIAVFYNRSDCLNFWGRL
jgi:hypothetical protein